MSNPELCIQIALYFDLPTLAPCWPNHDLLLYIFVTFEFSVIFFFFCCRVFASSLVHQNENCA